MYCQSNPTTTVLTVTEMMSATQKANGYKISGSPRLRATAASATSAARGSESIRRIRNGEPSPTKYHTGLNALAAVAAAAKPASTSYDRAMVELMRKASGTNTSAASDLAASEVEYWRIRLLPRARATRIGPLSPQPSSINTAIPDPIDSPKAIAPQPSAPYCRVNAGSAIRVLAPPTRVTKKNPNSREADRVKTSLRANPTSANRIIHSIKNHQHQQN